MMAKSSSINWKEIADELEHAPDNFLQTASKLWRSKLAKKPHLEPQKLGKYTPKDTEQQARWKAAHDLATDELLYFGEFRDKGEHIRLLQHVKIVNRTAKQIHIVAAYTLYHSKKSDNSGPTAWSTSPGGGLFGDFYTNWKPVTRYRLRQISKANLYNPDVLKIPQKGDSNKECIAHMQGWKRLCSVCLFANEGEYADWHIARYEDAEENVESPHANTCGIYKTAPDFYTMLGLSTDASQKEIKAAYKQKAMKHHPDRGGSAIEFHKVKVAYEALCENRSG